MGLIARLVERLRPLLAPVVLVELFVWGNLAFLAVDVFVAHSVVSFAVWTTWIPVVFSVTSPVVLVLAAVLAGGIRGPLAPEDAGDCSTPSLRRWIARALGVLVGFASVAVGVGGMVLHLDDRFFREQTIHHMIYAAPFAAPLAYAGLGLLLVLNRMVPSRTSQWARWVVFLALGGFVGNFALSLADHAQNGFFNSMEWVAVVAAALAVGILAEAIRDYRNRRYLWICLGVMAGQIGVALLGWYFHLLAIVASPMPSLWDKILYSAPIFAPLLFADLAILAAIGLAALQNGDESN